MADALHNYLNMVNGVTRATREKAVATARALLAQAGLEDVAADAGGRVNKLAEEIVNAARANRELLQHLVTAEVERVALHLGFARSDDLASLRAELTELRNRVGLAEQAVAAERAAREAGARPVAKRPAKRTTPGSETGPAAKQATPGSGTRPAAKRPAAKRAGSGSRPRSATAPGPAPEEQTPAATVEGTGS